eukprot:4807571-Pyramimonas_sp.AAC.1
MSKSLDTAPIAASPIYLAKSTTLGPDHVVDPVEPADGDADLRALLFELLQRHGLINFGPADPPQHRVTSFILARFSSRRQRPRTVRCPSP